MTCPSRKSLLVYCCFIVFFNRTIIAFPQLAIQENESIPNGDKNENLLLPFSTARMVSTAVTSGKESSFIVGKECKLLNGNPGKCFPLESCIEWHSRPTSSSERGRGWQVCEWMHETSSLRGLHLLIRKKEPLTICCQEPNIFTERSSTRQLIRSFVEIPERKAGITQPSPRKQCGISFPSAVSHFHPLIRMTSKRSKRMVSGHSTTARDHPWMAALYIRGTFACGGTIVSERVIITSAHCLTWKGNDSHVYEVMAGSTALGSGTMYQVLKAVRHPEFSEKSVMNDIALVITVTPIVFRDDVNPICFPPPMMDSKTLQGLIATMTGFGTYYYGGPLPNSLQETKVPIQGPDACSKLLAKLRILPKSTPMLESLVCAGFHDARTDACQGDSGGPLTIKVRGKTYLIGVISFGYKCSEKGYFGVSTAVTHFSQWIQAVMRKESNSLPLT